MLGNLRVRRGFARRELWVVCRGTKRRYIHSVRPVGYPDTAIICGSLSCLEPGLIWLEQDEAQAYR